MNKNAYFAYSIIWLSTAMAVSVGIYFTHSVHCLWFMLIPTLIRFREHGGEK